MSKIYKIKPSLLSSYGLRCDHCLWMAVRDNWSQGSLNLTMNSKLTNYAESLHNGKKTQEVAPEIGEGVIIDHGGLVASKKLPLESINDFYIAGEYDHLAKLVDGTFAVIDVKTSGGSEESAKPFTAEKQIETYNTQINAYAYCLENPASEDWLNKIHNAEINEHPNKGRKVPVAGERDPNFSGKVNPRRYSQKAIEISRIGLNNFLFPKSCLIDNGNFTVSTKRIWAEGKKDYNSLIDACKHIAQIIEDSVPPSPPSHIGRGGKKVIDCSFCADYARHAKYV